MRTRRQFITSAIAAGIASTVGTSRAAAWLQQSSARRQVTVGGRRVKTVDMHAHVAVPGDLVDIVKGTPLENTVRGQLNGNLVMSDARLRAMDEQGIDVEVLTVNAYWYAADRDVAARLIPAQNEALVRAVASHRDRFVPMATVALQHPDLAAEQLQYAVEKLGMRGAGIGATVNGDELANPKFDPFWAKAESLGALIFMHPAGVPELRDRLQGNGFLTNVIGNPLETTIALSHLIFEGTLDRFPRLKLCGAHAGGFSAVVHRPLRPRLHDVSGQLHQQESEEAERVSEAARISTRWCSPGRDFDISSPSAARTRSSWEPTIRSRGRRRQSITF